MINIIARISIKNRGFLGITPKYMLTDKWEVDVYLFSPDYKVISKSDTTEFLLYSTLAGIEIERGIWHIDDSEYDTSLQEDRDKVIDILNSISANDTDTQLISEKDYQLCEEYAENYSSYIIASPNRSIWDKKSTNRKVSVLAEDEYYRTINLYYTNELGSEVHGSFTFRINSKLNEKLSDKINPMLKFNAKLGNGQNVVVQYNGTMNIVSLEPVPDAITLNLTILSYKGLVVNSFTCSKVPPLEGIVIAYPQFSGLLVNN